MSDGHRTPEDCENLRLNVEALGMPELFCNPGNCQVQHALEFGYYEPPEPSDRG